MQAVTPQIHSESVYLVNQPIGNPGIQSGENWEEIWKRDKRFGDWEIQKREKLMRVKTKVMYFAQGTRIIMRSDHYGLKTANQ